MSSIFDLYDIKDELGKGAFSVVKLALNKKTGEKVAVKVIDKTQASAESDEKRLKKNGSSYFETSKAPKYCLPEGLV